MTSQLTYQCLRNRIIESLEWFLESEFQIDEWGLNELINVWGDFVTNPPPADEFAQPVYTETEDRLLRKVDAAVDTFCDATPNNIEDEAAAIALPQWAALITAAREAHQEMMKRGRFSEDEELLF